MCGDGSDGHVSLGGGTPGPFLSPAVFPLSVLAVLRQEVDGPQAEQLEAVPCGPDAPR